MNINTLFFELIQVALGVRVCLSHSPTPEEWKVLYDIAKKQSLVGICFAGIQKLVDSEKEDYCGMPEMLYLTWMGMAAKIQQRNEIVNKQCVGLCSMLEKEGFRTCILKGQGTAALYWVSRDARLAADARLEVRDGDGLEVSENPTPSPLTTNLNSPNQNSLTTNPSTLTYIGALRQSGDIDVWVMPKDVRTIKESRSRIDEMVQRRFPDEKGAFVHIGYPCFQETEVEVHYVPTMDGNPWVDRRFRRLFEESQDECFANVNELGFAVPEPMVNVLFNLHHIKRHFINEGIGFRHILDLYFVLKNLNQCYQDKDVRDRISSLGMTRFCSGIIWGMQEVLGDVPHTFGIEPDERLGRFILQEIMQGGNFGHHDERLKGVNEMGFWKRWKHFLELSLMRARYFPTDVFWSYVFRLRIGIWRKTGIEI